MKLTYLLLAILLLTTVVLLFVVYKKLDQSQKPKEGDQNLFVMLQQQIQDLTRTMDQKITDTQRAMSQTQENLHKTIQSQFGQSTKIIADVTERLTKLDETNRQVISFTDQVKNLERVLTNSKNRGTLGESNLELILSN